MKISIAFDELCRVLNFSSVVLSDKIVEDKLKNIIFIVKPESVVLASYNALTFCRTELESVSVEDVTDSELFQVKYSDLSKIISGFSSLSMTKVCSFVMESEASKIKVTVSEESIRVEDSRLNQKSVFRIDRIPLIDSIRSDITMDFPDGSELVRSCDVLLYVDSLLPIMSNDAGNSIANKMNMADDYVFVITSYMSAFIKNRLPEAFKGITLGYSSVNFLKRLCDLGDMSVVRSGKFLCVSVGMSEAFMRYQNVRIKYQQYVKRFSKENGLLLNRLYMKDVLRRMGNMSPDGMFEVLESGDLKVENSNFNQIIPVEKVKGEVSGIKFKISVSTAEKLVIGKDESFPEEVFMYIRREGSGYSLFFSDKTGAWFSISQVR